MSERARKFVSAWIEGHIQIDVYVAEEGDGRPEMFAQTCEMEALNVGISADEIREEYPDLLATMAEAIGATAQSEVDRLLAKDP